MTVTGLRQSGKTMLCRHVFNNLHYANLESPDQREFAKSDPRGFLSQFNSGTVLDEVQHVPEPLSYLQVIGDEKRTSGLFVLTASEQFGLSSTVTQSLSGRISLLRLLPFSLTERRKTEVNNAINDVLFSGFYPSIHDQKLNPQEAVSDYFAAYLEQDITRMESVGEFSQFETFVRLCAGHAMAFGLAERDPGL